VAVSLLRKPQRRQGRSIPCATAITEVSITELSKIPGTEHLFRPHRSAFRDESVTPGEKRAKKKKQVCQQLGAAMSSPHLAPSRRAPAHLTPNSLITRTDFPLWSERFDREEGLLRISREMALKIAEPLSVTCSPPPPPGNSSPGGYASGKLQSYDLLARQALRTSPDPPGRSCLADCSRTPGHGLPACALAYAAGQRLRHVLLQLQPHQVWV